MLHPVSGQRVKSEDKEGVELGDCATPNQWNHSGDGSPMKLLSNGQGLKSVGDGKAPMVSDECSGDGSNWTVASKANLSNWPTKLAKTIFAWRRNLILQLL